MKYSIKRYLGLLLVVVMMGAALVACGNSNKPVASKVDCSKQTTQLKAANSDLEKATAKLKDAKGTPDEKQFKQAVDKAQATIDALGDCKTTEPVTAPQTTIPDLSLAGADLAKIYQGFEKGQVKIGGGKIPKSPQERATVAFTKKTIETRQDLVNFFASDNKLAKQAKARVVRNLRKHHVSNEEIKRAISNGDRWIWVAPTVPSSIMGTTYPSAGGIIKVKAPRGVAANDAIWYYVTEDGHVYGDVSVRADCGNAEVIKVTPIPPGHVPPSITCVTNCVPPPPTPYCKSHPTAPQCLTPKDPTKDVLVNPNVPDQVKGPGTTPVGTNPGPAVKPVDSSTGCDGPCPVPTSGPSPTNPPTPPPDTTPVVTQPPATGTPPPPPTD